jgi:hypothetical protein
MIVVVVVVEVKCNNGNNFSVCSESVTAYDWQVNNSSLRGRRRTYLTILKRAWSADSKMVRKGLLQPLRPEFIIKR